MAEALPPSEPQARTLREVQMGLERFLTHALNREGLPRTVVVRGVYRDCGGRPYGRFAYDRLEDAAEAAFDLKVPLALRPLLADGQEALLRVALDLAVVQGRVKANLEVLEVLGVRPPAASEEEVRLLRALGARERADVAGLLRNRLRQGQPPYLALVYGQSGIINADVDRALGPRRAAYRLEENRVALSDPAALARALRALAERGPDAIAVVRGGGEGLGVFDHPALLAGVLGLGVPLLSAVGHEADHTLFDRAADLRLSTPTALGHWLGELAAEVEREQAQGDRLVRLERRLAELEPLAEAGRRARLWRAWAVGASALALAALALTLFALRP